MMERELEGRMQSVLDGEASPDEARELERRLAADAAARARFEELKALFGELAGVPPVAPPDGLTEKVIDQIAALPPTARQLSAKAAVFAQESDVTRGAHPGPETRTPGSYPAGHTTGGNNMSDKSFFGNRKALIGTGIAAAAVIFGVYYVRDLPTDSGATSGTIAPAQRYRAQQPTSGDVKLGEQGGSPSSSNPTAGTANQASSNATNQASSNATNQAAANATNQATNQAASQMSNEAKVNASANATNQATANATNQATANATNQASNNAVNKAANQGGGQWGGAVTQATSNAANQATNQANVNASVNATNQAAANAANQAKVNASVNATNQATNQAASQVANEAAAKATNQAANKAASQASNEAANKAANQAANKAASQVSNEAMKK